MTGDVSLKDLTMFKEFKYLLTEKQFYFFLISCYFSVSSYRSAQNIREEILLGTYSLDYSLLYSDYGCVFIASLGVAFYFYLMPEVLSDIISEGKMRVVDDEYMEVLF